MTTTAHHKVTWEETVVRTRHLVLSEADLRELLHHAIPGMGPSLANVELRLYIVVPSGGDYSGMGLDIDEVGGLHAEVTTTEVSSG